MPSDQAPTPIQHLPNALHLPLPKRLRRRQSALPPVRSLRIFVGVLAALTVWVGLTVTMIQLCLPKSHPHPHPGNRPATVGFIICFSVIASAFCFLIVASIYRAIQHRRAFRENPAPPLPYTGAIQYEPQSVDGAERGTLETTGNTRPNYGATRDGSVPPSYVA